ncbi:MAG: hypothetical protein QFF03_20585 [Pseudomonadota bacterium]|nr:hypothetical protein [Pseudomonadota bacterium]
MFLPLAYCMLAGKYGLRDADEGLQRLKLRADAASIEQARTVVAAWKPGQAMPAES